MYCTLADCFFITMKQVGDGKNQEPDRSHKECNARVGSHADQDKQKDKENEYDPVDEWC